MVSKASQVDCETMFQFTDSVFSPVQDANGNLFAVSSLGDVFKIVQEQGTYDVAFSTGGKPKGLVFDNQGSAFIADEALRAIMNKYDIENKNEQCYAAIKDFDGKELLGPNSMCLSEKNNLLFFTDSGPLEDCGLEKPNGSVYVIDLGVSMLKPVLQNCLAHPWGIAMNAEQNVIYVAETLRNRILRVIMHSSGAYYTSVFHQFAGGLGPSAITIDAKTGNLYVARFDHLEQKADGLVTVLSDEGEVQANLIVRNFPELTGLCFDSRPGKSDNLYATESATNSFL